MNKENSKTQYSKFSNRSILITAIMVPFAIGFVVELVQGNFIPGRMFDYYDILANDLGALVGAFSTALWMKKS